MKRAREESETFKKTCSSSSSISPGLLWCCYFSLVAQLATRSNGYLYAYAWTPARSHYRPPVQTHTHTHALIDRQLAKQEKHRLVLGFGTLRPLIQFTLNAVPTGTSIGIDAEPHEAQTTTTDHNASERTLTVKKSRKITPTGTSTVLTQLPAHVSSLGITWTSPVSGLGTSWRHPNLHSDASPLSTRSYIDSLKVADLKRACSELGLPKSGNKETLRDRLWRWATDRNKREKVNITGDFLTRYFEAPTSVEEASRCGGCADERNDHVTADIDNESIPNSASVPNSLGEWARTVDLNPLLQKRKEIHRQLREGRPVPQRPKEHMPATHQGLAGSGYLKSLARALRAPSSPYSSNIKVKELYAAAKQADQLGERMLAMDLLQTLLVVTPTDARVVRRLARMHTEHGDIEKAKETLKSALERQQENPWLWHGLGQLERNHGVSQLARDYFAKAIHYDATFAPAYHALGTMEHSQGNVATAMRIIKKGIEFCPSNHRLWHACGCFYRAAQMLEDADRCYRRALNLGPPTSHCFVYSALASVAYEQGDVDRARRWLVKAVEGSNGRHAHGWVALSQLEESENNVQKAQLVCTSAVAQYERGLVEMRSRFLNRNDPLNSTSVELTNQLLLNVPKYRSGDKFVHVYRNWARLEETYGSPEAVDRVYERACTAFPLDFKLLITWAQYHQKNMNHHKARELFRRARVTVGHRHADPFRISAEMEMSLSNFDGARRILRFGAQAVLSHSQSTVNVCDTDDGRGLPLLIHTWAICEWHLGNLDRAEALFAQALQLCARKQFATGIKSFILYSIARFKHYRGEFHLAQHCIGLIMKENVFPGGLGRVWTLWAEIARDMNNPRLEEECLAKAELERQGQGTRNDLGSLFASRPGLEGMGVGTETILSKEPWYIKLFGVGSEDASGLFKQLKFPTKKPDKGIRVAAL